MQGFNMGRYVPPDLEGTVSANQASGKHALGNRARKIGQGILTVRFEMPFAVWCTSCPAPAIIGQGVRFNAEKRRVGSYLSTPIWAFRMKHLVCGAWIEIRTDPKNTEYVVTEGGKRRDTGEDKVREGDLEIRSEAERKRVQEDAFAALEVKIEDRKVSEIGKERVEELYAGQDRDWEDPYAANKRVRKGFRVLRKEAEKREAATEALRERMGLGIEVLEESEEDRQRASAVDFGPIGSGDSAGSEVTAVGRLLFNNGSQSGNEQGNNARQKLQQALARNTRAKFETLQGTERPSKTPAIPGLKRKREDHHARANDVGNASVTATPASVLVDYDSD